jgi:hypothetical protein
MTSAFATIAGLVLLLILLGFIIAAAIDFVFGPDDPRDY